MAESEIPKTKSERIRDFGREGVPVAEIARRLDIRYQHARKVLLEAQLLPRSTRTVNLAGIAKASAVKKVKPALHIDELLLAGFELISKWKLSADGEIFSEELLPKKVGVYAFAKNSTVIYVGVATTTIAKRLRFYAKPGSTQRTSLRLNAIMKSELAAIPSIDIYVAHPVDLDWNGLPIHGSAGLELGLIEKYNLPWNKRSAG